MALTGNMAIIKNKSDEKLRWKVITTLSNRETRKSIPAAKLMWGNKTKYQTIRNEHIIHFDITEQSAMKTDETHRKYLE